MGRLTRLRLHQPVFRARVFRAYEQSCAICRLRHVDLLDAANILSDTDSGQPAVPNGLSLCKIHHTARRRSRRRRAGGAPGGDRGPGALGAADTRQ